VPTGEYNRSVCESPVAVWAVPIVTVATLFLVAFVFSNPFFSYVILSASFFS